MTMRHRSLPRGWYPDEPESLRSLVAAWTADNGGARGSALAAVAPHAGWTFSGRLAALAVASLAPLAAGSTVAIFGGHVPSGAQALAARETAFDTPLGSLQADVELLSALDFPIGRDEERDNTVEVLLPLIAAILPGVRVLWLRAPNDAASLDLGRALFEVGRKLGRNLVCLGSTDLTHYGPNYGFSPKGSGAEAEKWVRDTNDRRFIEALLALDGEEALRRGESERSACSSGAAAAALAFALAAGASSAELLAYATSLDVMHNDSFVGYAALGFF